MLATCRKKRATPHRRLGDRRTHFRVDAHASLYLLLTSLRRPAYHYTPSDWHAALGLPRILGNMGKRTSKRQKTRNAAQSEIQPLGSEGARPSLMDDASKDDEERRLESMLFGKAYVPASTNENILVLSDDEEDAEVELDGETELHNMLDSDVRVICVSYRAVLTLDVRLKLFFVDDLVTQPSAVTPEDVADVGAEPEEHEHEDDIEKDEEDDSSEGEHQAQPVASTSTINPQSRKAPAWVDPDDATLEVSLKGNKRLRKLRDTPTEDAIGGREYERRLRRQYEKINPTPDWAKRARTKLHPSKKRRASADSDEDEDMLTDEDLPTLLASTTGVLGKRSKALQSGTLSIERLRDANISAPAEGAIKAVQFHPATELPLLLTASEDRRLRFFNVRANIHSRYLSSFLAIGRRSYESSFANSAHSQPSHNERYVSSYGVHSPSDRSTPILLYLRPPVRRRGQIAARALGYYI